MEQTELEDVELLVSLDKHGFGSTIGWSELLKHDRVILLAEAGAGKSREMKEQVKRLVGEGRFAFCVPLESLGSEPLAHLLSAPDERRFDAWKADNEAPGWFFLDAVDELKLTGGKLDLALLRFSREIDGHLGHVRVIVSCRPSDWRSSLDLATVRNRLPVPDRTGEIPSRPPYDVFIEALKRDHVETPCVNRELKELPGRDGVLTVAMLPMSDRQIKVFAEQSGVTDAAAFLTEVTRQDAWDFARRPLDLTDLIANWTNSGRLGTRAEQHEANVTAKLKDDPERPDRDVLTDIQARFGAERLALALSLTRTRTIRSPEQAPDILFADGVLEAEKILPDWTQRVKPSKNLTLAGFVASLQNLTEVVSHLSFHVLLLAL